jgi:hypothetical protein
MTNEVHTPEQDDTAGQAHRAGDTTWLSRRDAAAACGCHVDTIRRYEKRGELPNKQVRNGTVLIPVSDLVAAGLLDPLANDDRIEQVAHRSRTERELAAARQEIAVLTVRLDGARARAERAEADVAFFKQLVASKAVL